MKKVDFTTPYYGYRVTLMQVEGKDDCESVCRLLKSNEIDGDTIDDVKHKIEDGYVDGAETNWSADRKRIICIFYECSNEEGFVELYCHEKRHVEDRILQHCGIDDIEAAGYLAGYIGTRFYRLFDMVKRDG